MKELVLFILVSCASVEKFEVSTQAITPFERPGMSGRWEMAWSSDGPDMIFAVSNRTDAEANLSVRCADTVEDGTRWLVTVPARGEVRGVGRLMNRNTHTSSCWVEEIK